MSFGEKLCAMCIILGFLLVGKSILQLENNNLGLKAQVLELQCKLDRGNNGTK